MYGTTSGTTFIIKKPLFFFHKKLGGRLVPCFCFRIFKYNKEIKVMKDIIIANQNRDLQILSYGSPFVCGQGTYRVISKCPAGYMTSYDTKCDSPYQVFSRYKMKHVHSIAFVREDGLAFTVYARTGKKVWITEQLLCELTVGDINANDLAGTALYCQYQYRAVGAKTWACKAYVMNQKEEVLA